MSSNKFISNFILLKEISKKKNTNKIIDQHTLNADYFYEKMMLAPERIKITNWDNNLPIQEKRKIIDLINKKLNETFEYKIILFKFLPYDMIKYLESYIVDINYNTCLLMKKIKRNLSFPIMN